MEISTLDQCAQYDCVIMWRGWGKAIQGGRGGGGGGGGCGGMGWLFGLVSVSHINDHYILARIPGVAEVSGVAEMIKYSLGTFQRDSSKE